MAPRKSHKCCTVRKRVSNAAYVTAFEKGGVSKNWMLEQPVGK